MNSGWWTIGRWHGTPIRLHWSVALSALLFSRFQFEPAFWAGFVLLILIHEFGHAFLVRRYRLTVLEIAVHGLGGYCAHAPARTREQTAVIAWGGVLAQALALAVVQIAVTVGGPPRSEAMWQLYYVFTVTNWLMILINLLPIGPLDGAKAWPLIGMLWRRGQAAAAARRQARDRHRPEKHGLRAIAGGEKSGDEQEEARKLVRELLDRTGKSRPDA